MKCPYCMAEMEHGTLRSRGGNYFLPDGKRPSRISFYTRSFLERQGAIPLPPDPYAIGPAEWPSAWCCRSCRKLILSYSD